MKKWILKAVLQKAITTLPAKQAAKVNLIFQKYVTKGLDLKDEYFYDRLGHAKAHLDAYKKYSDKKIPETCLELGTGWHPIVPISFFLTGATTIYSVDVTFLTSKENVIETINKILQSEQSGVLQEYLTYQQDKIEVLRAIVAQQNSYSLEQILHLLNITYLVEDARKLSLPDNSIDLINSNNTFEHIYPNILIPILKEFKRIVSKSGGVMSHFIDMSDHFAHFDNSITLYNFLRFSDSQWKWVDNTLQNQSRYKNIRLQKNIYRYRYCYHRTVGKARQY
ncbi:MAG: methyltransferase domain-containing protein [Chitinophagaceae bacterium]